MEVVISTYGGFNPSSEAIRLYSKKAGIQIYPFGFVHDLEKPTLLSWEDKDNISQYCTSKQWSEDNEFREYFMERTDPILIEVVKELGGENSSVYGSLKIVNIPDDVEYFIHENENGSEIIREKHRSWQ